MRRRRNYKAFSTAPSGAAPAWKVVNKQPPKLISQLGKESRRNDFSDPD